MNKESANRLIGLLGRFNGSEGGYLLSAIRHHVAIPGKLELQQKIQFDLEQLTYGLLVVYLFAIFEEHIDINTIKSRHPQLATYLAYRHIRHSFAHKISGERAKLHRSEFEELYDKGLFKNTVTWDIKSDILILKSGIAEEIRKFLTNSIAMIYPSGTYIS